MEKNIRRMCGIDESSRRKEFADFALEVFYIHFIEAGCSQSPCMQEWQECEVAGTSRYKLATWKFYYCLKCCYLQNIFVNPCEFLGLCWVVFRSRNFADAKRKEVVCITLGFFANSASGNGIWALGSGISKKNELGNGTGTPNPRPPFRTFSCCFLYFMLSQVKLTNAHTRFAVGPR